MSEPNADLAGALAKVIADPGSVLPRHQFWPGEYESAPRWAARAVLASLPSLPGAVVDTEPTWQAVVADRAGFVLADEQVRAWCAAIKAGKTGWGVPCETPTQVLVVTGSALPEPQTSRPDEDTYRLPGHWYTADRFLEIDLTDEVDPDEVDADYADLLLKTWQRVQAAAAGMNAAGVQ